MASSKLSKSFLMIFLLVFSTSAHAELYDVDPVHTQVMFKVRHMGIGFVTGRFTNFRGQIEFDKTNIQSASASAEIAAVSVDTDNMKRDTHLRSPDFFHAEKYPMMSFTSKKISKVSGDRFHVDGELNLHGIEKPVSLEAEYLGTMVDPEGNSRIAFEAHGVVNRRDFGLTWNKALDAGGWVVGDEVKIVLEVQGIKRSSHSY